MVTKIITCIAVAFLITNPLNAQDTIRLKNGLMLYGLITEVNNKEVKFRIDGGSVTLDQILSYQKGGQNITLRNTPATSVPTANMQTKPQECEIKNVGDVEFENKTSQSQRIYIYATGGDTHNENVNPNVATITVAAGSSVFAYNLTTGVHSFHSGGYGISGQVRISKCGVTKYVLQD